MARAKRAPGLAETGLQLIRFAIVGGTATIVHGAVAYVFLLLSEGTALAANLLGFAVAFSVSFLGNLLWVFRRGTRAKAYLARFCILSFTLLLASLLISHAIDLSGVDPMVSIPLVLAVCPMISYLGNRFWVFQDR